MNTHQKTVVNVYQNTKDTTGIEATLSAVHRKIRDGTHGLIEQTIKATQLAAGPDKQGYRDYKAKHLPAFTPAGTFPKGKRKAQYLLKHSGYIVIDIDGLTPEQVTDLLIYLQQHPHTRLAFISPSGTGIKAILHITPTPQNASEHKAAYQACLNHFAPIAEEFEFEIDTSGSDCSRLCFLAYHPQAIYNDDAIPIEWDYQVYLQEQEHRRERLANRTWTQTDVDISALDYIHPDTEDTFTDVQGIPLTPYDVWVRVGIACKTAGVPFDVWDNWSSGGEKYNPSEMVNKWDNFANGYEGRKITWGSVVYWATLNGYESPRRHHKPIKLHKKTEKTDSQLILETLKRSRKFVAEAFDSGADVFGIRADTGVGKTESVIQYLYKGHRVQLNMPHKNLMDESYHRLIIAEITPFAYRGILSNPDGAFPHDSPCAIPYLYDAYAQKGGNPRDAICSRCPFRGECEQAGHWFDLRQLPKHQANLFTFPQLFTNPMYRGWIQSNIGSLDKYDLILHDDTEITDLFNRIEVKREYLEAVSRDHKGTTTGDFADVFLSYLHRDNIYDALKDLVFEQLFESDREEIIEALSHVRINGQLMTLDEAVNRKLLPVATLSDINALPQVQDSEWTLLHLLELFFDVYKHADNAPIRYHEGILSFAIPPILPKTKARIGFMGATLQQEHLRRAFPEAYYPNVLFFDAISTEWHTAARFYQLSTNRNPRRTVLTDGKLNATGHAYFDSVLEAVKRLEGKHAIITYKSVIEEKKQTLEKHDVVYAHFGGLTGLDTRFKDVDYLHILFSPERPPTALEWDAKMIYGSDTDILSFDRDEAGNWVDERVQSVYDNGVIAELIQAIGRARLVLFGKKVFLWCSHYLPTITDRDQTHLFTERDFELWTDTSTDALSTDTLENIIAERHTATPKQVAEQEGVSERTAYRRTKQKRKQKKQDTKERNEEILRLHQQGHKQSDIVRHISKHYGKISKQSVSKIINKSVH